MSTKYEAGKFQVNYEIPHGGHFSITQVGKKMDVRQAGGLIVTRDNVAAAKAALAEEAKVNLQEAREKLETQLKEIKDIQAMMDPHRDWIENFREVS